MKKTNDLSSKGAVAPDLLDKIISFLKTLKLIFYDPLWEIYVGSQTSALPTYLLWTVGSILSLSLFFHLDDRLLLLFHRRSIRPGYFRDFLNISSVFWGFFAWGYYRMGVRGRIKLKLERAFVNAGLETKLKETPQFRWDFPLDEFTRKLRLRGRGLPLSAYFNSKEHLEHGLNVTITKIENPDGNRELVDIIYTTQKMLDFWTIDNPMAYKNFSFPIGKSHRGDIVANFRTVPHLLAAGESGGGKSTFIRLVVYVTVINNLDVEVYFIDFKKGMENQLFSGFENIHLIDEPQDAAAKMNEVNRIMDNRMTDFKNAKATNLEMYNRSPDRKGPKEKRIIVVVDEVAELMPTVGGKSNPSFSEVNSILNRISRLGRAVGINLVIGVQKPDAKNLDPTIKANLSGVVCFAMTHFTQSTIALGNGRAAELNPEIKGRAIWKRGTEQIEVQVPLLTEKEVVNARTKFANYWKPEDVQGKKDAEAPKERQAQEKDLETRRESHDGDLALEGVELSGDQGIGLQKQHPLDSLSLDETPLK